MAEFLAQVLIDLRLNLKMERGMTDDLDGLDGLDGLDLIDPIVRELQDKLREQGCAEAIATIRTSADLMYESNTTDIEDFYDLIIIVNDYTCMQLQDRSVPASLLADLISVRVYCKKCVKRKFRDWKYNKRHFWNDEEAEYQYFAGKEMWQESVAKIRELAALRPELCEALA